MKKYLILILFCGTIPTAHCTDEALDLDSAISSAKNLCSGISEDFNQIQKMAGIGTVVSSVGTGAGIAATATGFIKAGKDEEIETKESRILEYLKSVHNIKSNNTKAYAVDDGRSVNITKEDIDKLTEEIAKDKKQSKNLGNARTGLLAGSTATNIATAAIAGASKIDESLQTKISNCLGAVEKLSDSRYQARLSGEESEKISAAEKIIYECDDLELIDLNKIDNRSKGALWSSVAGAATGAVGTVSSAIANTDKTRAEDARREKNLNLTSNIMAIGTTVGGGGATVFNASQISALKKASEIADKCAEVLK